MSSTNVIYRFADTLERPLCKAHADGVLLCWCGYVRPDQALVLKHEPKATMIIEIELP